MGERYNFSIKTKCKVGRLINLPFCTAYFADDAAAILFKDYLLTKLANYAKVSVSKVIFEPTDESWEIPSTHTLNDTEDVRAVLYLSTDKKKRFLVTIPGIKAGIDMSDIKDNSLQYYDEAVTLDKQQPPMVLQKNVIEGDVV